MKNLILIVSLFLFISCTNDEQDSSESVNITTEIIAQGGISRSTIEKQNMVIKNKTQWEALIKKMNEVNNESSNFKETEIDFSKYQILASFYKKDSNGMSTRIHITQITARGNTIYAKIEMQYGFSNDVSQPFLIVKIPASSKKVVFE